MVMDRNGVVIHLDKREALYQELVDEYNTSSMSRDILKGIPTREKYAREPTTNRGISTVQSYENAPYSRIYDLPILTPTQVVLKPYSESSSILTIVDSGKRFKISKQEKVGVFIVDIKRTLCKGFIEYMRT